jgi:hypothetical protein
MNLDRAKKIAIFDYDDSGETTRKVENGISYLVEYDIAQYRSDWLNRPCFIKWVWAVVQVKSMTPTPAIESRDIDLHVNTNIPNSNSLSVVNNGPSNLLFCVNMGVRYPASTHPEVNLDGASYTFQNSGDGFFCSSLPGCLRVTRMVEANTGAIDPNASTERKLTMRFRLQIEFLD